MRDIFIDNEMVCINCADSNISYNCAEAERNWHNGLNMAIYVDITFHKMQPYDKNLRKLTRFKKYSTEYFHYNIGVYRGYQLEQNIIHNTMVRYYTVKSALMSHLRTVSVGVILSFNDTTNVK